VLLDMRMPTLDGWGFASAMRDRGLKYPVVVVTAAENARAWAQEIGADAYLAKPFQLRDLLRVVERFCPRANDRSGSGAPTYH
jgi:DNA-binding response OmpR family regulator